MLLRDLTDAGRWIKRIIFRLDRLEAGAHLENSSVTDGQMRFIGGLLRVDSGGRVEIVGTLRIDGVTSVTGEFTLEGPWSMTGDGTITGDVTVTGKWVQTGEWELNGNGKIQGNVEQTGDMTVKPPGKMVVEGAHPIRLRQVGGLARLDLGTTASIWSGGDGATINCPGGGFINVYSDGVDVAAGVGGTAAISGGATVISPSTVRMTSLPLAPSTDGLHWIAIDPADGRLYRVSPSVGGPMGSGEFAWPFDPRPQSEGGTVSNEAGPDDAYDDGYHKGIDFAVPGGTSILAPAGGTVIAIGYESQRGYYVIVDHGTIGGYVITTRYYHLQSASPLSEGDPVVKGSTELGLVGTTGMSTGNHLHWETRRDGAWMNPRTFMAIYGE